MRYIECFCFNCAFDMLVNAREHLAYDRKTRDFLAAHMRKILKEVRDEEIARNPKIG